MEAEVGSGWMAADCNQRYLNPNQHPPAGNSADTGYSLHRPHLSIS